MRFMRIAMFVAAATILLTVQTQPPDTEVFLARLTLEGGNITVASPENISKSPGYDNQPSFTSDGSSVFFTSARGGAPQGTTTAQMDIYRYDIASRQISQVTRTAESEYSPTVTPDGRHISVVRVEADKTQRLWRFPLAGGQPSVLMPEIKPVGYHAWLDADTVAMFVLGEPATLQVGNTRTRKADIVASDIGRSLQQVPGGGISFVQRAGQGSQRTMTVSHLTVASGKPTVVALTPLAPGATDEFVAWTPDGTLLMAAAGYLHAWRQGDAGWRGVADLKALGLRDVSRLSVSPKGNWLAVVAAR